MFLLGLWHYYWVSFSFQSIVVLWTPRWTLRTHLSPSLSIRSSCIVVFLASGGCWWKLVSCFTQDRSLKVKRIPVLVCFCYYFFAVTPPQTRILKLNMGVWTQMMSKLQTADLQVRQKKCSGLVIISIGSTNEFHLISRISPIKDDIARVVVWVKSKLGNLRGRSKPGRVRLKKPGNKGFLK